MTADLCGVVMNLWIPRRGETQVHVQLASLKTFPKLTAVQLMMEFYPQPRVLICAATHVMKLRSIVTVAYPLASSSPALQKHLTCVLQLDVVNMGIPLQSIMVDLSQ